MKIFNTITALTVLVGFAAGASAVTDVNNDGIIDPTNDNLVQSTTNEFVLSGDITTSIELDPAFVYMLDGQVIVKDGASLTIPAGTVIRSNFDDTDTNAPEGNSVLIVNRGGQLFVQGTSTNPVVFTSTDDGTLGASGEKSALTLGGQRDDNLEWGSIVLNGKAYIGAKETASDGPTIEIEPDGPGNGVNTNDGMPFSGQPDLNINEGLEAVDTGGDPAIEGPDGVYGGTDDDDDSGSIKYLAIRYGGLLTGVTNSELNGISLGGVGRGTEVSHIDIWNNVDDGIETFGGTVNYKFVNLWNIGDDSFDVDQGWRGSLQHGLIVQGASGTGSSGSGVGDNVFEVDGAEPAYVQPVTTALIANVTVVGQPESGDEIIEFRDGTRVQFRNILIADGTGSDFLDETSSEGGATEDWRYVDTATVTPIDGDATFGWDNATSIWDTPYTAAFDTSNSLGGGHPTLAGGSAAQIEALYPTQTPGNSSINQGQLAEITNTIAHFAFNGSQTAGEIDNVGLDTAGGEELFFISGDGVLEPGEGNPFYNNKIVGSLPIGTLTRGASFVQQGFTINPVSALDPRPTLADAQDSGFEPTPVAETLDPVTHVGGFSAEANWALGWTAADSYGIFVDSGNPVATNPTTSIALTAGISFPTEAGAIYRVEVSTNGTDFTLVDIVEGTGSTVTVPTDQGGNAVFRVTVQ